MSGATPAGAATFTFSTGGPVIVAADPYHGSEIEEEPYFRLFLSGPVDVRSVEEKVSFINSGIESPIESEVVTGALADEIWAASGDTTPPEQRLIIKPKLRLAPNTKLKLVWGAGVRDPSGEALETEQVYEFSVRGPLTASVWCQRINSTAGCIPFLPVTLNFSAPISIESAGNVVLRAPSGQTWKASMEELQANEIISMDFAGPFPESTDLSVDFPSDLKDDIGRPLEMAKPLIARIDASPPLAKFHGSFGIIERGEQQLLPITVRNIEPALGVYLEKSGRPLPAALPAKMTRVSSAEEILELLGRVRQFERGRSIFEKTAPTRLERLVVPRTSGGAPLEVVGIPLKAPGFYGVEVESPALGQGYLEGKSSYFVRTAALVTDLAVHLKVGAERSLVWVSRLHSGEPVADATVTVADCRGKARASGRTDARGVFLTETLPSSLAYGYCPSGQADFIALATHGDDLSFALSSWTDGIEMWRFDLPTGTWGDTFESAHTVLAQSLVRRGDTVKMKHLLRRRTGEGLKLPEGGQPSLARLTHQGSYEQFDIPLKWRGNGSAESQWAVPAGAKLGSYAISLVRTKKDGSIESLESGLLRVEDYRVPLMRGVVALPEQDIVRPTEVQLTAAVAYLSGGGAQKLPVTVRYKVTPQDSISFPGLDGYAFGAGVVETGRKKEIYDPSEAEGSTEPLLTKTAVLDDAGTAAISLDGLTPLKGLGRLSAELEYKDVAGFVQTVKTAANVWPAETILGIKTGTWISKESVEVELLAVSPRGERRAGVPVSVELYRVQGYSHRKRIVGGVYSYDSYRDTNHAGTPCSGKTDETGLFRCTVRTGAAGEFLLEGRTTDVSGRLAATNTSLWITHSGRQWFGGRDDDRIDVIPEKPAYEAGETARFQVRTPFDQATALVTVEREGVIDAFVQPLNSRDPIVTVPLNSGYAPNVFVSVLVVRGRVAGVTPTAMVDLGRPAFKLGFAKIEVGWKPHEVAVTVTPDREVYKVREKARVTIKAVAALDGKPLRHGEVALAAVDEGLLELQANDSWLLLRAMMGARPLDVFTATAQMFVVGRRHFGLKARPEGGGGGRGLTRELFDALLYWNPRVTLDEKGEASVEVPLNDSLTSFRIAAVVTGGASLFGTGTATIRATHDLIVIPGFAPVVRHGDSIVSSVALRNTTASPLPVELSLSADDPRVKVEPENRVIEPGGSAEVRWRLPIPEGIETLTYTLEARVAGKTVDRVTLPQRVLAPVVERVYGATFRQVAPVVEVPVAPPPGAMPGRGGLVVGLAARLGDGLAGVKEVMQRYPYTCLEQRVSQAVALADAQLWSTTMAILPTYVDGEGNLKFFVTENQGSSILTAYVLSTAAAKGWEIPMNERRKMIEALRRLVAGKISFAAATLQRAERLSALEALTRAGEDVSDLVQDLVIDATILSTSELINWYAVLSRSAQVGTRNERLEQVRQVLRGRLNLSGTELGFSTEKLDREWWLMSSVDLNAVRLLDLLIETGDWKSDIPKIAQGALARQRDGAWDLTTANAWGTLALSRFSERFESAVVSGETKLSLGGTTTAVRWSGNRPPAPVTIPWTAEAGTLKLEQRGNGSPWATVQSRAAIPLREPLWRGYTVRKSYAPVVQRVPGQWSVGDIVRVKLSLDAQADRNWVVIDDPLPPGAVVIGGQSLSQSLVADSGARSLTEGRALLPTFEERTFEAYRAYFANLEKGSGELEYTVRLNTAGEFVLPEVRVEALYSPDMFGALPNDPVSIAP